MDVASALLLPSFAPPPDALLRNLALYWDRIVVVRDREEALISPDAIAMRDEFGLITEVRRDLQVTDFIEPYPGYDRAPKPGEKLFFVIERDALDRPVIRQTIWLNPDEVGIPPGAKYEAHQHPYAWSQLLAEHTIARVNDALELCANNNLAPPRDVTGVSLGVAGNPTNGRPPRAGGSAPVRSDPDVSDRSRNFS